jgi:hypothetical protein
MSGEVVGGREQLTRTGCQAPPVRQHVSRQPHQPLLLPRLCGSMLEGSQPCGLQLPHPARQEQAACGCQAGVSSAGVPACLGYP